MRITQVQMKETKDKKYSGLGGMDERDKIPQGLMEGMEDQRYSKLDGKDER